MFFMLLLFSDITHTFARAARDVHLYTLVFVVDLGFEQQQKLCTQTEPVCATCVVCGREKSP